MQSMVIITSFVVWSATYLTFVRRSDEHGQRVSLASLIARDILLTDRMLVSNTFYFYFLISLCLVHKLVSRILLY
jgi:hypothetical protein